MDLHLKNHTAVIVGGSNGIGLATAKAFAAEGASVAIWDRDENVTRVAEAIAGKYAVGATASRVDITDEQGLRTALDATENQLGNVDHLVHTAAIGSGKYGFPFTNLRPGDWPRVLEVNIMGMVNVAHVLGPAMAKRTRGTMLFLASVAGQIGSQTDPPYSAAKAANINFAQCLAKDLAPYGVRVNSVCPGMVQTTLNRSIWQAWHDQAPEGDRLTYEEWAGHKIRSLVPLGEWQTPEAIADMILFLSSDRAAHITGQTINVDGGFVMHW